MGLIPNPPADIADTIIYQALLSKSTPTDGLAERVEKFISWASPMLDLILAGPFHNYTLHNPNHSKKLVHLAGIIISSKTIAYLSALELSIIIMSCYLHDLGMCLTSHERSRILSSMEFEETIRIWPQLGDEISATRLKYQQTIDNEKPLIEPRLFQLQEAALTSYLRPRHATTQRYRELISQLKEASGRSELLETNGVSFENELIEICVSHNLDAGVLLQTTDAYTERFPRDRPIGGLRLNSQFCGAILRLVDVLDFDRERTPRVLFESLGIGDSDLPGSDVSIREWNKHMAVHAIDLRQDELIISADSTHPAIEHSIKDFCKVIEREIRDTLSVLRKNPPDVVENYQVDLPLSVRAQIRSLGYVYKELAFILDESSISTILMGEGLYYNKVVALRELIQNAADACIVRKLIDRNPSYEPLIEIFSKTDKNNRTWIEVKDNGIGMDEYVLSNYFFKIGRSYYNAPEFERIIKEMGEKFSPISRFGIGILSVFMIGDILELSTQNKFSRRGDIISRNLRIEGKFGLAFVKESIEGSQGTTIRLRLKERSINAAQFFLSQAANYIRDTIPRPPVPLKINLVSNSFTLIPSTFISLRDSAAESLNSMGIEPILVEVGRWSERISGRVILFLFRNEDGKLAFRNENKSVILYDRDYTKWLKNYGGNRITVNGITMTLKRLGRIFGKKRKIFGALDIDLKGDKDIIYDVARKRIVGTGALIARIDIRKALIEGLKDMGILARLDSKAKSSLTEWINDYESIMWDKGSRPVKDDKLLDAVFDAMPKDFWPIGIHHEIAKKLKIPSGLTYRAISTLIESGRLIKPETT